MIRPLFIAIGFVDHAIDGVRTWFRTHRRMTVRARMLIALWLGVSLAKQASETDSLGSVLLLVVLTVIVVWTLDGYAASPRKGESANAFAIRVAKEHGVEATLAVTNMIYVIDPPTWHAIEAKRPTITADGHIEVQS